CSEWGLFVRIAVPLSKNAVAVIAVITFMNVWNDFMAPLIYLTEENMFTITVALKGLMGGYDIDYGVPLAGALLSSIPTLIFISIVGKKYLVEGLSAGAVKG